MSFHNYSGSFPLRRYGPFSSNASILPLNGQYGELNERSKHGDAFHRAIFDSEYRWRRWLKNCNWIMLTNIFFLVFLILLIFYIEKAIQLIDVQRKSTPFLSLFRQLHAESRSRKNNNFVSTVNATEVANFLLNGEYHSIFSDEDIRENPELGLDLLRLNILVFSIYASNRTKLLDLASFLLDTGAAVSEIGRSSGYENVDNYPQYYRVGDFALDYEGFRSLLWEKRSNITTKWKENMDDIRLFIKYCPDISSFSSRCFDGGYYRASGHLQEEYEQSFPLDDISLLKFRYATQLELQEVLRELRDEGSDGPLNSSIFHNSLSLSAKKNRQKLFRKVYAGSSVLNRRYYYPLRRYSNIHGCSPLSVAETSAWRAAANLFYSDEDSKIPFLVPPLSYSYSRGIKNTMKNPSKRVLPKLGSNTDDTDTKTIFISVASYRDVECARTLLDGFKRAKNPFRLYFGVAEQNARGYGHATEVPSSADEPCVGDEFREPISIFQPLQKDFDEEIKANSSCSESSKQCWSTEADWRQRELESFQERLLMSYSEDANETQLSNLQIPSNFSEIHRKVLKTDSLESKNLANHVRGFIVPEEHIRIRKIPAAAAKGPTFGRFMTMLLYRGEDFILVIDSHHRFVPHWDVMALYFFSHYNDRRTVLSHYPEAYEASMELERDSTSYLCNASFSSQLFYPTLSALIVNDIGYYSPKNKFNLPYLSEVALSTADNEAEFLEGKFRLPQPWVAGGFLFASSLIFREVPFDPHLPYLFEGEEVLLGVRLWTHGYNLYSPPRNLAYHFYTRAEAPKAWKDLSSAWYAGNVKSQHRTQYLLRSRRKQDETTESRVLFPEEVGWEKPITEGKWNPEFHFFRCQEEQYFLFSVPQKKFLKSQNSSDKKAMEQAKDTKIMGCIPPPVLETEELFSSTAKNSGSTPQKKYQLDFPYPSKEDLKVSLKVDLLRYGLGNKRTISEWYDYSGANPFTHKTDNRWCE